MKDTGREVIFLRRLVQGATDKSYGVHVAELAGIPKKVTERALVILKEAMAQELKGGGKTPRYTQMLLVDTGEGVVEVNPAVEELRAMNLDEMTPLAALNTLHRLRNLANGGNGQR